MIGHPEIIAALNARLSEELTAITQYGLHRATLAVWEYPRLLDYITERIEDEKKHFSMISERIRFLEGVAVAALNTVTVGEDIVTMHGNDLGLELNGRQNYLDTIGLCLQLGDAGTRVMLEAILVDEEDHIRDLEAQLTQIQQMTVQNYLSSKI